MSARGGSRPPDPADFHVEGVCEPLHGSRPRPSPEIHRERALARLAATQRGLLTRGQLIQAGLTRGQIKSRLANGRLHPVHRGVYAVGHLAPAPLTAELAALLALGAGAVLSHASAAQVWGILAPAPGPLHVACAPPHRAGPPGITVHRVQVIDPRTLRRREGLSLTSPVKTLLDLAATMPDRLPAALNEARIRRLARPDELSAALTAGRRGVARARELLDAAPAMTRSEAERRLLALIARARLPTPEANVRCNGHEVDLLWRLEGLVVEIDGYAFHGSRQAFERDRLRDAELIGAGLRVLRVTWRQLTDEPEALVARLATTLSRTPLHP